MIVNPQATSGVIPGNLLRHKYSAISKFYLYFSDRNVALSYGGSTRFGKSGFKLMTEAILPYMSGIHFVSIKGQNLALPPQSLEGLYV